MKKTLSLLALVVVVIGGTLAYNQYVTRTLNAQLTKDTAALIDKYGALIDDTIPALKDTGALTQKQQETVVAMGNVRTRLAGTSAIQDRVSGIHDLQLTLVSFLMEVQPGQSFAESAQIATIQREMGKNSSMRDSLTAYNETARKWNDHTNAFLGSITSTVARDDKETLPYLRFDGEQEFFTTIRL